MHIYTIPAVFAELLITQLLDFAISVKQNKPTTKVTKRHQRIMLVRDLLPDELPPEFVSCLATYHSLYDDMIAMQHTDDARTPR